MSQDRSSQQSDSDADLLEGYVEFAELDSSLSTALFWPHTDSGGQPIVTNHGAVPGAGGEWPAPDSAVTTGEAAAASVNGCHEAMPVAEAAGARSAPAAAAAAAAGAADVARAPGGSSSSEQDQLLRELIGQLAKQGGSSRGKEESDVDADVDYIRIEPHDVHENAMAWSSSSVGSRFSFLIQRTQADDESDLEDPADEPPAPAGAVPQDADDREESDQVLPLAAAEQPRQVGAPGALLQHRQLLQQQLRRWWQHDGDGTAAAGLADPAPSVDGYDPSSLSSPLWQPVRHYKHDKNSRVNGVLSVMAAVALVLAVGIGIGHCIGSAREASLQQQIRDDQDSKLRELREDLLMCLRKQEDISQTITKLNEIEAILVDAEHWRSEYEELLKLKVQAEDGWRRDRADLLGQLEHAKAELGRVQACHHDSEFMSRQELKLDDVHAKLQVALDHKERQALGEQLTECKANMTARDEATRGLKTAIDNKNRAIVLLKEQLLDRERELVKATASCSPAGTAAAAGGSSAAGTSVDHDRPAHSHQEEKSDGLAACQRQLLRSLERVTNLEISLQHAQSQLLEQTRKQHSCQEQLDGSCRGDDSSSSKGGSSFVGKMAAAHQSDSPACGRPSRAESYSHAANGKGSEAELRRCARMVLAAREAQRRLTSPSAGGGSSGQLALDRSLRLFAAATSATVNSRSSQPKHVVDDDDAEASDDGEDALRRLYRGTRSAVEGLLGAAKSTLRVANSSLHALANTSASLLHEAGQSAADASRKWNVSEKVSAAAAGVRAGVRDVADMVASAWETAAAKAKEAAVAAGARAAAATTGAAEGDLTDVDGAPAAAAEAAEAVQKPPVVNATLFWAEFKELRQLVSNFTERSHLAGEGERTYGAVAAFLRRYNVSEAVLPGGSEWKAWCSCQLAWWTGRLQSLEGVVDCSDRLADWQVDVQDTETNSDVRAAAARASALSVDAKAGDKAKYSSADLIAPEWIFERAAEREFVRDTPDDWYWRKVKEAYSQMYKLFSDGRPQQ